MFGMGSFEVILLLGMVCIFIFIFPFWKICKKMGYPGITCLLLYVPIVGIIFIFYLAFTTWPIEKELNSRKN